MKEEEQKCMFGLCPPLGLTPYPSLPFVQLVLLQSLSFECFPSATPFVF